MSKIGIKFAIPILASMSISLSYAAPPASGVNTIGQLNCKAGEVAIFDGANWICSDITARLDALEAENQALKDRIACVTSTSNATEFVFEGCNVHVRNGAGQTNSINGVGNLIVGYDAARSIGSDKTGSHNMIIGDDHNYTSYGGFVAGDGNAITDVYASISGGQNNTANAPGASISGGVGNTASGSLSSVSGGTTNTASGPSSNVSGGVFNTASGASSSVSGGSFNTASDSRSNVSGGTNCEVALIGGWGVGDANELSPGCVTTNTP